MKKALMEILRRSKDSPIVEATPDIVSVFEKLGIEGLNDTYNVDRDTRIQIALRAVTLGVDIEEIVATMTWKDFESMVATILSRNDYRCIESFRRRGNRLTRGMEIDVIGVRNRTIVSVDAKMWNIRRGKTSALRRAAEQQKRRTEELAGELQSLSHKIRLASGEYRLTPVLVTWLVEDLTIHEGVPIVPVFKFNSFIIEMNQYEDMMISFEGRL